LTLVDLLRDFSQNLLSHRVLFMRAFLWLEDGLRDFRAGVSLFSLEINPNFAHYYATPPELCWDARDAEQWKKRVESADVVGPTFPSPRVTGAPYGSGASCDSLRAFVLGTHTEVACAAFHFRHGALNAINHRHV
jgi:hypothetical protein